MLNAFEQSGEGLVLQVTKPAWAAGGDYPEVSRAAEQFAEAELRGAVSQGAE